MKKAILSKKKVCEQIKFQRSVIRDEYLKPDRPMNISQYPTADTKGK
ncbi:hypothetical protein [Cytobacillus purgationiresistens]|uniref:Uncharacterized protein n=1 Tax=Cytobacillus purgationiresistens TaxID=863449 RepID=A0ABU0AJ24_9BACI|nr:hypothetical protein [Cytobacillus purgationiresistens]MDQ0271247.1 hypothetical protein [Cytobacillus purgationiresistens]